MDAMSGSAKPQTGEKQKPEQKRPASSGATSAREVSLYQVRVRSGKGTGEEQELYVQAYSSEQIRGQYETKGYVVLGIKELVSKGPVTFASITLEEKAEFCYLLAQLVKAGIPFKNALNIILSETGRPIARAIPAIIKDLDEGKTVIEAFHRHPGIFDDVMIAVLRTGEKSGEWSTPLLILAESFEKQSTLKNAVKLALLYPAIVVGLAIGIVAALSLYVFPNFIVLYREFGVPLPVTTKITIAVVSIFTGKSGILFFLALALFALGVWRYYKTDKGRLAIQFLLLHVGPVAKILEGGSIAIFSRTLSILVGAGGLLHECLGIAAESTTLEKHRVALLGMVAPIRKGEDPATALEMNYAFTQPFKHQFVVGATTGRLDSSLTHIAEFYEKEVARQIGKINKTIEPVMIVLLGGMIAWLVISMYMPLFSILSALGD